jgi:hypothetical protein
MQPDQPGTLDGTPVPAMSLTGMLAMKGRTCAPAGVGETPVNCPYANLTVTVFE